MMINEKKSGLRIAEMHITPIAITDPPLLNAAGMHAPYALRTVIELVTDDNVTGVSEIPGADVTNVALELAKEIVVGKDPFQINGIFEAIFHHFGVDESDKRGDNPWDQRKLVHICSAIEVACLDLIGKYVDRPVVDLLGGAYRERVPFAAYLFYKHEGAGGELGFNTDPNATGWAAARQAKALTEPQIVEQAEVLCKEFGFKSIKLKGGVFEPEKEMNGILALREAFGPNVPLRLDPNALWTVETSIKYGRKMEGVLEYLEDPTRGQANMAKVRNALNVPLATNMCTTSFADLPESIRLGSEDIILADHHYWGGLRNSVELARICDIFGRGISMHSNSHLGISLAAMVHLGAAIPNLRYSLDTHYPWQSEEIVEGGRLKFEDGSVEVPREPGLGVKLDHKALEKLHQNFTKCLLTCRNDEIEMQKIEPGWKFMATRW
jgi:glucarate dehydratase